MTDTDYDPIPLTVDDALKQWDAGESVFSVEMGGIGPGYEMAIQGLVFEMLRELRYLTLPPVGAEVDRELSDEFIRVSDEVAKRCDPLPWARFSGAQVSAAQSLVACIMRRGGYRAALRDEAVKDRLIQVCKKDLRKE